MNELRRYLPMVACLVACGSDPAPAPTQADAGPPVPTADASLPTEPADAGADARGLVVVSPDKLGCDGNMRIDGPAIDVTGRLHVSLLPDRAFVSFTDGTFGAAISGLSVEARRLDGRLNALATHKLGRMGPSSGHSGNGYHVRDGARVALAYGARTAGTPSERFATLLGYDFETDQVLEIREEEVVAGYPVSSWGATGDDTASYFWAVLAEGTGPRAWRRTYRKDSAWQRTALTEAPATQWQEGGKTHFGTAAYSDDVVLAADGAVESSAPIAKIADTDTPCARGTTARAGSGFVTVRLSRAVPCNAPAAPTTRPEVRVHLGADPVGRLLGTTPTFGASNPDVEVHAGPRVDAFVSFDPTDGTAFTAKLQRLDDKLQDLGGTVEVRQPGRQAGTTLAPIAGGYFWFVHSLAGTGNIISTSAYHVVCGG